MNNSLIVNNIVFPFEFIEEKNLWYLGYNEFDVLSLGHSIDITFNGDSNWDEVRKFLFYLTSNIASQKAKVEVANMKLKVFFYEVFKKSSADFKFEDVYFTLSNIQYIGLSKDLSVAEFEYTYSFNVESISDPNFFTYDSWNVLFRNESIIDVYKS